MHYCTCVGGQGCYICNPKDWRKLTSLPYPSNRYQYDAYIYDPNYREVRKRIYENEYETILPEELFEL